MRLFLVMLLSFCLLMAQDGDAAQKKKARTRAKSYPTGTLQTKKSSTKSTAAKAAAATAVPVAAAAAQKGVHPTVQYLECSEMSQSQPDKTLAMIEASPSQADDPSIQHCKAMALYNLGRFQEAGTLLNQLTLQYEKARIPLALDLLHQAYRAWQMAEDKTQVLNTLNHAVSLSLVNNQTQLGQYWLEERASWLAENEKADRSVQDWDHLLTIAPTHAPWLVGRAQAFDRLNLHKLALADYRQALAVDPANKDARRALSAK